MTNDITDPVPPCETAQPIAVLDFEASSLPGPGSYPIEVGVAFAADGATRSWLIRPELGWSAVGIWDPAAERLHGLTRETLQRDGRPVEEVTVELAAAIVGHAVVSDAASADGYWLLMLYAAMGQKPPFRIAPLGPLQPSMSRVGNPYDNAKAESFMKTLKHEEVDAGAYRDAADARARIGAFIEEVYNRQRLHSALAYRSPVEYEQSLSSSGAARERPLTTTIATCP